MNQLCLTLEPPKARRRDPSTSHAAAKAAERFQASHAGRILEAIRDGFSDGMNADLIAESTGLTVVQVDRRTVELQRKGLIRVRQVNGRDVVWNGMRVWELV